MVQSFEYILIERRICKVSLTIIAVYVDDLNLIGTPEGLLETANYLKNEFEIKDLGKLDIASACRSSISQMEFLSINQHTLKKS